ncbi:helix-turn-helix domain-containing protein [Bacillus sp. V3B]|uniref:helix-turn-helix domain-containing protein n=1 Tax=Bacillus sp. V3B TaxID=2804915 RepID=UPI0028115D4B|nr:helix-turn-helix domain-containing protein [Bacillus sp. V3B]
MTIHYFFINPLSKLISKSIYHKVNQQKLNQAIAMYHSEQMTVKEIQEATGVSAATIYRELKKEQN